MIGIEFTTTGDTAEAETPEGAMLAARTLWDEGMAHLMSQRQRDGYRGTIVFTFEDGTQRTVTNRTLLGA